MTINFIDLPETLIKPLEELKPLLSYSVGNGGTPVRVQQNATGPKITVDGSGATVEYHKIPEFCRLLTLLPSRMDKAGVYEETPAHEDLCLMSDCSRNAVYHMEGARRMIRYLALMGFTAFMLYTEDTYEIPEYPKFGYMRGRFTQEEIRQLDDYAATFGIELIPCIQVLGHLTNLLRWSEFEEVKDTAHILLADDDKADALIEAMLKSCRACYRTHRIHIGMDETHDLGLGRYLDKNGYHTRSEIFLKHLSKMVKLCEKYDFSPMIWSDMFFRNAFNGQYYVSEGEIPSQVIALVPSNVSLVYWDYYNYNEKKVRHMLHCHHQFDRPVVFAGGAWKWNCIAPRNYYSLGANDIQLKLAKEEHLPMVIATTWGDNGAECSNFSVMPTLQQYAEYCYADGQNREWVKERFAETFGMSFDDFLLLDSPNLLSDTNRMLESTLEAKHLLYNDPLGGMMDYHVKPCYADEYAAMAEAIAHVAENQFSYLFRTGEALCRLLALKATLSYDIRAAYEQQDRDTLRQMADERIPATLEALERYLTAVREEWQHDNKAFGFEIIEIRLGGLRERLVSTRRTLEDWLEGRIPCIERLEEPVQWLPPTYITYQRMISACPL